MKDYGITIKRRVGSHKHVELDLADEATRHLITATAIRVIHKHSKVLRALAKR